MNHHATAAATANQRSLRIGELLVLRLGTLGRVFVVTEGGRSAVARTVPEPTAGLVVYDLRTALHRFDEDQPVKPKARKKRDEADA